MIHLEKTDYGIRLTFADPVSETEVTAWSEEMRDVVPQFTSGFSVFADLRAMELFSSECKPIVQQVQSYCMRSGFIRSVVILAEELTAKQLQMIATRSGIRSMERYIVASKTPDWERIGYEWVANGVEPDIAVQQSISPSSI